VNQRHCRGKLITDRNSGSKSTPQLIKDGSLDPDGDLLRLIHPPHSPENVDALGKPLYTMRHVSEDLEQHHAQDNILLHYLNFLAETLQDFDRPLTAADITYCQKLPRQVTLKRRKYFQIKHPKNLTLTPTDVQNMALVICNRGRPTRIIMQREDGSSKLCYILFEIPKKLKWETGEAEKPAGEEVGSEKQSNGLLATPPSSGRKRPHHEIEDEDDEEGDEASDEDEDEEPQTQSPKRVKTGPEESTSLVKWSLGMVRPTAVWMARGMAWGALGEVSVRAFRYGGDRVQEFIWDMAMAQGWFVGGLALV
jgi:hypothetical protein